MEQARKVERKTLPGQSPAGMGRSSGRQAGRTCIEAWVPREEPLRVNRAESGHRWPLTTSRPDPGEPV